MSDVTNHPIQAKPKHVCETCSKSFQTKYRLNRHEKIHTGVRAFQCKKCTKTFITKQALTVHVPVHDNIKPYQCEHCKKTFTGLPNYKKHQTIHSKPPEKSFTCLTCGKKFAFKHHVVSHQRYHATATFKCECGRAFTARPDLTRHQSTHTRIKPFKCHVCHVDFRRRDSFNRHMRHFHPRDTPIQSNATSVITRVVNGDVKSVDLEVVQSNAVSVINGPVKADRPIESVVVETADESVNHLPRHYETSFNSQNSTIKNIKFKLPPDYLSRLQRFKTDEPPQTSSLRYLNILLGTRHEDKDS